MMGHFKKGPVRFCVDNRQPQPVEPVEPSELAPGDLRRGIRYLDNICRLAAQRYDDQTLSMLPQVRREG